MAFELSQLLFWHGLCVTDIACRSLAQADLHDAKGKPQGQQEPSVTSLTGLLNGSSRRTSGGERRLVSGRCGTPARWLVHHPHSGSAHSLLHRSPMDLCIWCSWLSPIAPPRGNTEGNCSLDLRKNSPRRVTSGAHWFRAQQGHLLHQSPEAIRPGSDGPRSTTKGHLSSPSPWRVPDERLGKLTLVGGRQVGSLVQHPWFL